MIFNLEPIYRMIRWAKSKGSPYYWIWVLSIGIFGAIDLIEIRELGWSEKTQAFTLAILICWIISIIPLYFYEKHWKKKQK